MWSFGRYGLGLSEESFWALTPRQFSALSKQYEREQEQLDRRVALVACVIANSHSEKPHEIEDFMPRSAQKKQTDEEILAMIQGIKAKQRG